MCLCGKVTNFVEIKTIMRNNTVLFVGSIGLKYMIIIISVIINMSYIANTFINIYVDYAIFLSFFVYQFQFYDVQQITATLSS